MLFLDFSFDLCFINFHHLATPSFSPLSVSLLPPPLTPIISLFLSLSLTPPSLSLLLLLSPSSFSSLSLLLLLSHSSLSLPLSCLSLLPIPNYQYIIAADLGAGFGLVNIVLHRFLFNLQVHLNASSFAEFEESKNGKMSKPKNCDDHLFSSPFQPEQKSFQMDQEEDLFGG